MVDQTTATAAWVAALGTEVKTTLLYTTRWAFPGELRRVLLLGAHLSDDDNDDNDDTSDTSDTDDTGINTVAVVAEGLPPRWFSTPDWSTTRTGKREREEALLRLATGGVIRDLCPDPPSSSARETAAQGLAKLQASPFVRTAVPLEVVEARGYGGVSAIYRVTRTSGHDDVRDHEGRCHIMSSKTLRAIGDHPTWYFLGLRFHQNVKAGKPLGPLTTKRRR